MRVFINRISELIIKHLDGSISQEEKNELQQWLNSSEDNLHFFEQVNDKAYVSRQLEQFYGYDEQAGWEKLVNNSSVQDIQAPVIRVRFNWQRWAVAAILILGVGTASWFIFGGLNKSASVPEELVQDTGDIKAPAGNKAMITLADGRQVSIDSLTSLAVQQNIIVTKVTGGQIVYNDLEESGTEVQYNTLTNPRGSSVINLVLSDGTQVWLNAESSLRYPVAFNGDQRKVEITGEAYFEVAKDQARKFFVDAAGTVTEVLGTHFNVNAYGDKSDIRITLLEGSVNITGSGISRILAPGQQARAGNDIEIINDIDLEEVMAWKNGLFSFRGADIQSIMKEVSRWYDVEVVFTDTIKEKFYGDISRNTNASNLFKMLETTGSVHFKIDGRIVEVKK